jgi:hypothetical protein
MVRQHQRPFILSQVTKDKFGSSANIHTAPKEVVEAVTSAARIREIANSVDTNTTQGAKIAVTANDDDDTDVIPADTEALNVKGYRVEDLHKEYYCFQGEFPQYKTKSTNGVPNIHLKEKSAHSFLASRFTSNPPAAAFPSSLIKRTQQPKPLPARLTCLPTAPASRNTSLSLPTTPPGTNLTFMPGFSHPFALDP